MSESRTDRISTTDPMWEAYAAWYARDPLAGTQPFGAFRAGYEAGLQACSRSCCAQGTLPLEVPKFTA